MNITKKISLFICLGLLLVPSFAFAQAGEPIAQPDTFHKGLIIDTGSQTTQDDFGQQYLVQDLSVKIEDGEDAGKEVDVTFEQDTNSSLGPLEPGDRVIVGINRLGSEPIYYVSDVYRISALWWLLAFFFVVTVAFAGKQGLRAFAGLALTFAIIFLFVVPKILGGSDPVVVSVIAACLIALSSLYVAHGVRTRTHIAFAGIVITFLLAFGLGALLLEFAHLTGLGTEDAFYLQYAQGHAFDLHGLLLAAIMIGALGVLDDVTTAQAAAVEEIHLANKSLSEKELYKRGISVGKEHITSLVNTLVLAYTGASFPLLLLFGVYERPIWVTVNSEIIFEELIRMLVGSIALIFAVPITTYIAARHFGKKAK